MRYSALRILKEGLTGNKGWTPAWREPEPKSDYDIVIIGGGGHGLSTAYYLAKEFGAKNVAVLEKGWLGSGNIGRNTTIIRSNYLLEGNQPFYELSLKLWEGLEQDFNYNAMVSQRGILNLYHSDGQRDAYARRGNAMALTGADGVLLGRDELRRMCPFLDFDNARFPIHGALWQPRAGTVRHDAVAWGYARGADERGVDILQNCEVTGIDIENGRVTGVQTSRGPIRARKVAMCAAGSSGRVAALAGMRLPIESHVLQAFVSEGLKPVIPGVITFGAGHFYVSQSDKGGLVFGGDIDGYNTYAQRGNLPVVHDVCEGGMAIMPLIGRARLLRMWGGVMDMSTRPTSRASTSTAAGATAASRRRPPRAIATPTCWPPTGRIPWRASCAWTGSAGARRSTRRARAPSRTCTEPMKPFISITARTDVIPTQHRRDTETQIRPSEC